MDTQRAVLGLSDEDLAEAVYHHVLHRISERSAPMEEPHLAVDQLPLGLQWVFATMRLDQEVRNGGFLQFIWNPSRLLADQALEGFRQFGATQYADLVKRALDLAVAEWPEIQGFKAKGVLAGFSEAAQQSRLHDLDREYFRLDEDEIIALRAAYVRAHAEDCELTDLETCWADPPQDCPLWRPSPHQGTQPGMGNT